MFAGTPRVITRTVEIDFSKNISHEKAVKEIEDEADRFGGASFNRMCWLHVKYKDALTEEEYNQLDKSYHCSK